MARSPRRNELKCRVTDELFDALERVQDAYRFSSMNDAANFLLDHAAFGLLGNVRLPSHEVSRAVGMNVPA